MTQKREPAAPGAVESYPVLPLRDIVVFPHMIVPLFVGREKSIRALEEVMKADSLILLATQMNASDDDPATDAIFTTGTLASVLQLLKLPDGTVKVFVEGQVRAKVQGYTRTDDFYEADAEFDRRRSGRQGRGRGAGAYPSSRSSRAMSNSTRRFRPKSPRP